MSVRRTILRPPIAAERIVKQYQRNAGRQRVIGYVDFATQPNFRRDIKNAEELDELADDAYRLTLRHKIFADETKYYAENYKQKRKEVEEMLTNLMDELWREVPAPHLRLEYSNVLSFFATIREFFASICEFADADDWFVSCDIIDRFSDYVETIHQIRRYTSVDLRNFVDALDICDEIMKSIQAVYRIRNKLMNDESPSYPLWEAEKYCSYHYEWFCGNIISGPHQFNCVKWLCASRTNQLWMTSFRLDSLAATKETFFDYLTSIPVPFPKDPDPKLLLNALYNRETERRDANDKSMKTLLQLMPDNTELKCTRNTADFVTLRSDIRRKKRNVAELIVRADRKNCLSYYLIITTLARVEAELLMLHKAFAPSLDKTFGFYGRSLPRSVFEICHKIYVNTNVETCKELPLNPEIETLLKELRKECRLQIKNFYEEHEINVENYYSGGPGLIVMQDQSPFPYELDFTDFPEDLQNFTKHMIEHLYWEQFELERLHQDYALIKQGVFDWPKSAPMPFLINAFKPYLDVFYSNFALVYAPDIIHRVQRAQCTNALTRIRSEQFWGGVIIKNVDEVIEEAKCVPSISEVNQVFGKSFEAQLTDNSDLEGLSISGMATVISEIVNSHIAISGYRTKYSKGTSGTVVTAKRLADVVTATFMEYKQTRESLVLKKQLTPKTKLKALAASRIAQKSIIERLDLLHQQLLASAGFQKEESSDSESGSVTSEPEEDDDVFHLAPDPSLDMCLDAMTQVPSSRELFIEIMSTGMFGSEVPSGMVNAFLSRVTGVLDLDPNRNLSDMNDRIYNVPID